MIPPTDELEKMFKDLLEKHPEGQKQSLFWREYRFLMIESIPHKIAKFSNQELLYLIYIKYKQGCIKKYEASYFWENVYLKRKENIQEKENPYRICFVCSKETKQKCGFCKGIYYCSKECQNENSEYHRIFCEAG
jgi:hypothetical protein